MDEPEVVRARPALYEAQRELEASVHELEIRVAGMEGSAKEVARNLVVQAKEYERRLGELNEAHDRAERVAGTYLLKTTYDKTEDQHSEWRRAVDKKLDIQSGRDASKTAIFGTIMAILALLLGLLNLILKVPH